MGCIFCGIAARKTGAHIISETDRAMALLDAFPLARGHTLVIPKAHSVRIQEMDGAESAEVFDLVRHMSLRVGRVYGDALVAVHNGAGAGQEIPHVHVHIVPRAPGDGASTIHSMFGGAPARAADSELAAELERLRA